ncbi:MAG: glycosyltransferase family 2 protein [Lactococcus lactis]|uniref:glycosyltransferase family 2 protein n=1 Tax=Lactococcus lactis TaxID=1358 RepID=UPI0038D0A725
MENKVSIVVTCYNHEKYIEQCLRSIFAQTHKDIELIVINDGSEDNSEKIIRETLKDSPYLESYFFSTANHGVSSARNFGLEKITGKFLLYIDSDNYIDKNYVEYLLSSLDNNGYDIAYCQLWDFKNDKDILTGELSFSLERELKGNMIDVSSLVRVSILKGIKFDEKLKTLEDYDFWLQAVLKNKAKVVYVSNIKLNYRMVEGSRNSRGNWEVYYDSYFYILKKYIKEYPELILNALKDNIFIWLNEYLNYEQATQKLEKEIINLRSMLHESEREITLLKENYTSLRNSKTYKIGEILTAPFRKIRKYIATLHRSKK